MPPARTPNRLTPDQRALVEANIPLVAYFIGKWGIPENRHQDAFQDGFLGLVRAAQLYDPTKGFRFSTYAQNWIRNAIQRGRGRIEGISYRTAEREGFDYLTPMSLDAPLQDLTNTGRTTHGIGEIFVHDPTQDPEAHALAAAQLDEIRRYLEDLPLNALDRAIADELLTPSEESWRARDTRIAERFGFTCAEIPRRRRKLLQARIRSHASTRAA